MKHVARICATVAHVSDLHFGSSADQTLLRHASEIVVSAAPDVIVVSGDLVDHPFPWQLRQARRYLEGMANSAGVPWERVLVVPGNHDYKIFGNLGLRYVTRVPFEMQFREAANRHGRGKRLREYARLTLEALMPGKGPLADSRASLQVWDMEELGLLFLGFNSTPPAQLFATGKVGGEQIAAAVERLEALSERYRSRLKVAVVHHHPLPIAYVGTGRRDRLEESLMTFYNAGTFMRELSARGVDLVLHGHKHFSGFTRVIYDSPQHGRCEAGVLSAGSASHSQRSDPMGWNLNLIRVHDDEQVEIEQRYFTPEVIRADSTRVFLLRDLGGVSAWRRRRLSSQNTVRLWTLRKTVTLTRDGFSKIEVLGTDCVPIRADGIASVPLSHAPVARPAYIRGAELTASSRLPLAWLEHYSESSNLRRLDARVRLGGVRQIADGPFDLGYRYRLMNGHALDAAEFARKYSAGEASEYATLTCDVDAQQIELVVEFPDEAALAAVEGWSAVALYAPRGQADDAEAEHVEETQRIRTQVDRQGRTLTLQVPSPVPDFSYRIRWRLKAAPVEKAHLQRRAQLDELCRFLVGQARQLAEAAEGRARDVASGGSGTNLLSAVRELLNALVESIVVEYPECVPGESLDVSLAVAEPAQTQAGPRDTRGLRFVASTFGSLNELFPELLYPGEGCAGFAFEKKRTVFYNVEADEYGYYISPTELAKERPSGSCGLREQATIFAIPVIDPVSNMSVGVISIGSAGRASRLLRFFELDASGQARESARLQALTATLLLATLDTWTRNGAQGHAPSR